MVYAAYFIFWFFIPLICVYFRIRGKIKTGFALGMVITSLFLGFITANTFKEKIEQRFIRLINEQKISEAERVLQWILQKNPRDLQKIEISHIRDRGAFQRMKQKLAHNYMDIVRTTLDSVELPKNIGCDDIEELRDDVARIRNALRLLEMVEALGEKNAGMRVQLQTSIDRKTEAVARLESACR
jgi:hypothetical protein